MENNQAVTWAAELTTSEPKNGTTDCGDRLRDQTPKSISSLRTSSESRSPNQTEKSTSMMDCDNVAAPELGWTAETAIRARDSSEDRLEAPALFSPPGEQALKYASGKPRNDTSTFASDLRVLRRTPSMEVHVGRGDEDGRLEAERRENRELINTITHLQFENDTLRSERRGESAKVLKYRNEVARREEKYIGRPLTDSERLKLIQLWEGRDARV